VGIRNLCGNMARKYDLEHVRSIIESEGYELLSKSYNGAYGKLEVRCGSGHVFELTLNSWKKGRRCPFCLYRTHYHEVNQLFESNGYKLLVNENNYENVKQKLKCICPNGHHIKISFQAFKHGTRCKRCRFISRRISEKELLNTLHSLGFVLLYYKERFRGADSKIVVKCQNDHVFTTYYSKIKAGHGCKQCHYIKLSNKYRLQYSYVKRNIEGEGYKLISHNYNNAFSKLELECPSGHKYFVRWNDWQQGCRCPKCNINISSGEQEIIDLLNKYDIKYNLHDRELITPLELDIVIPKYKLAIEYCGLYWHSDKFVSYDYHQVKLSKCNEVGYKLLTIFSDEFELYKDEIKNFILSLCGVDVEVVDNIAVHEIDYMEYLVDLYNKYVNYNTIKYFLNTFKGNYYKLVFCIDKRIYNINFFKSLGFKLKYELEPQKWFISNGNTRVKTTDKYKIYDCGIAVIEKINRVSLDYVKYSFELEGYKLIGTEKINGRTKYVYKCPNGHKHSITWNNWKKGVRCYYCSKNVPVSIDFICEEMAKEGYTLLSNKYINRKSKLDVLCPNGHFFKIGWNAWSSGKHRCKYCNGGVRHSYNYIRASFEREGYKLLTKKYINNKQKLVFICPNGHKYYITWSNWKLGYKCAKCANNIKKTIKEVRKSFEDEGYYLLTSEYKNSKQKLECICLNNHYWTVTWSDWVQGYRCKHCYYEKITGEGNINWRGGSSRDEYCKEWYIKGFKDAIKKRDGYKCLNPLCDRIDNKDLTVHHIDYNKKNCDPNNLITLCRRCNIKANSNREWFNEYYNILLKIRLRRFNNG